MKEFYNTAQRFSIRKYSIGAASVLLGAVFLAQGQVASADQVTDSAETPQVEVTSSEITETVTGTASPLVVEVVEKPIVSPVEVPEISTPQADEILPAKVTETPAPEVPEKVAEEALEKATQGYAAAQTEKPTSSVSTDTTRRRAPKNTRKAPEAFQNTARGFAKAEVAPETSTSPATDQAPAVVGSDRTATAGQTGFFNARSGLIGDNYPWKHGNTNVDQDNLGYPVRQCTSFVAYRLATTNKVTNNISYLGNAGNWGYTAVGRGARVDKTPAIGAVAWFKPGDGWSDRVFGHVSWVAGIRGDKVLIEEYNRTTPLGYGTYEMPISMVTGFIHFKDLAGGQPQATSHTTNSSNQSIAQSGSYTFTQRAGIRAEANMASPELAYYSAGQSVNYDSKVTANGYEWLSYLSFAGNRRYIAIKEVAKPAPKQEAAKPTTGTIIIQNNNAQTGTFDIIISNVYNAKGVQAVVVPTWSDKDGQDDIKWYEATRQADGTYKQTVKASDHKNSTGLYHAHLYYRQNDGSLVGSGGTTTTVSVQVPQHQQANIPYSGTYRFTTRSAVRPEARMASAELAYYNPGQTVNYDRTLQAEGRTWLSYIAASGNRRYIAIN